MSKKLQRSVLLVRVFLFHSKAFSLSCRVRRHTSPCPPPQRTARDSFPSSRSSIQLFREFFDDADDGGKMYVDEQGYLRYPYLPLQHSEDDVYSAILH